MICMYHIDGRMSLSDNQTEKQTKFTLKKTKFLDLFEGGMNAKKHISIADTSKATATRNLQDLVEKNAFIQSGGPSSKRHRINLG